MKKIILRTTKILAILLILCVASIIIFLCTFNPNQYKSQIVQAIYDSTGLQANLAGNIELSLFPTPQLNINNLKLSNKHALLANIPNFSLSVKILPLLEKQLVIESVSLSEPTFNITIDQNNQSDWQVSTSNKNLSISPKQADTSDLTESMADITLAQLTIRNASIKIKHPNKLINLDHLYFSALDININKKIALQLDTHFRSRSNETMMMAKLNLKGNVEFDTSKLQQQKFIESMTVHGKLNVPNFIYNKAHFEKISSDFEYIKGRAKLNLNSLQAYDGFAKGDFNFNQLSQHIQTNLTLSKVDIGQMLYDINSTRLVSGKASSTIKLSTTGITPQNKIEHLNGKVTLKIDDGQLNHIDADGIVNAVNQIAGNKRTLKNVFASTLRALQSNQNFNKRATPFDFLTAHVRIKNGHATTNDLQVSTNTFQIDGNGQLSLVHQRLQFDVFISMLNPKGALKKALTILDNKIPFTVKGKLSAPKTQLDTNYVLEKVKQALFKSHNSQLQDTVNQIKKGLPKLKQLF